MNLIEHLQAAADAWCSACERSLSRLATMVVNDGKFFDRISAPGGNVTTATLERFARYLHDPANWPDGLVPEEACQLAHRVGVSGEAAAPSAGNSGEMSSEEAA